MQDLDWQAIAPTRALDAGDARYVRRPWGGGDRLGTLVRNGLTPIAVTGPMGSGKTTEVRRALDILGERVFGLEIPIERLVDADDLRPELLVYEVAQHLLDRVLAADPDLRPSRALVDDIRASDPRLARGHGFAHAPAELAQLVVTEVRALLGRDRVALFIDGLDRVPSDRARAAVRALLSLRHVVDLVVVVPPALANGPDSHELLAHMRLWWVPTVPVHHDAGRRHLEEIALRRLGLDAFPAALHEVLGRATAMSGGITRSFLQLFQDAALYASADGRDGPDLDTLADAIRDHADAMRRVLVAGDLEALARADQTDGLEVPADRRVRFLAHNVLLEYAEGEDRVVRPHPLLQRLIDQRKGEAAPAPKRAPRRKKGSTP